MFKLTASFLRYVALGTELFCLVSCASFPPPYQFSGEESVAFDSGDETTAEVPVRDLKPVEVTDGVYKIQAQGADRPVLRLYSDKALYLRHEFSAEASGPDRLLLVQVNTDGTIGYLRSRMQNVDRGGLGVIADLLIGREQAKTWWPVFKPEFRTLETEYFPDEGITRVELPDDLPQGEYVVTDRHTYAPFGIDGERSDWKEALHAARWTKTKAPLVAYFTYTLPFYRSSNFDSNISVHHMLGVGFQYVDFYPYFFDAAVAIAWFKTDDSNPAIPEETVDRVSLSPAALVDLLPFFEYVTLAPGLGGRVAHLWIDQSDKADKLNSVSVFFASRLEGFVGGGFKIGISYQRSLISTDASGWDEFGVYVGM